MLNIVSKTDPMSGKDFTNVTGLPSVVDNGEETSLTIYFESEGNRRAYLDIPVEHPTSELSVNLDNFAGSKIGPPQAGPEGVSARDGANTTPPTTWSTRASRTGLVSDANRR
jgi:hypothetical protein